MHKTLLLSLPPFLFPQEPSSPALPHHARNAVSFPEHPGVARASLLCPFFLKENLLPPELHNLPLKEQGKVQTTET